MGFDITTFIVEIINFLVLVWILKRLLYSPINNAILAREKSIQEKIDSASSLKERAKNLEEKYENRLLDWEKEKDEKNKKFQEEMFRREKGEVEKLHKLLDEERQKNEAISLRQLEKKKEETEKQALLLASNFAGKFLQGFADENLEKKIISEFLNQLSSMSDTQKAKLLNELHKGNSVQIETAYSLSEEKKKSIVHHFEKISEGALRFNFNQNKDLYAGINVKVGSINFQANLRDELKYFEGVAGGSVQQCS